MDASEIGTIVPQITTESQARELARVEPTRREEVIRKADIATGGKTTAAAIKEAEVEVVEPIAQEMPPRARSRREHTLLR